MVQQSKAAPTNRNPSKSFRGGTKSTSLVGVRMCVCWWCSRVHMCVCVRLRVCWRICVKSHIMSNITSYVWSYWDLNVQSLHCKRLSIMWNRLFDQPRHYVTVIERRWRLTRHDDHRWLKLNGSLNVNHVVPQRQRQRQQRQQQRYEGSTNPVKDGDHQGKTTQHGQVCTKTYKHWILFLLKSVNNIRRK